MGNMAVVIPSKKSTPKKGIKDKLDKASELYEEVKKEADAIKKTLRETEVSTNGRDADKRAPGLGRN